MTRIRKTINQNSVNFFIFFLGFFSSFSQTITVSSEANSDISVGFMNAMHSKSDTILIEKGSVSWQVSPMKFRNLRNKVLLFEEQVVLRAKPGAYPNTNDSLLEFKDCENIVIIGNGAELCMNKEEYEKGEWRHGISLRGSKNVRIENVSIRDTGGDGVYIAGSNQNLYSEKIQIKGIKSINNKRQGISIVSAKNVQIQDCLFEATQGTLPSAGIDIEPNRPKDIIVEISVTNCTFQNNFGTGILIALGRLNSSSHPISVNFNGCEIKNNYYPDNPKFGAEIVLKANKNDPVKGVLLFNKCFISNSNKGFLYSRKRSDAYSATFIDCMVDNVGKKETAALVSLEVPDYKSITGPLGGVNFDNLYVKNMRTPFFMSVRGSKKGTLSGLHDVKGQITIDEDGALITKFINYINYSPSLNKDVDLKRIKN